MNDIHPKINEDGTLQLTENHQQFLSKYAGKYATVSIPKPSRSGQQNRFYWFFLKIIENETGNNATDLHDYFKIKILPPRHIVISGKVNAHDIKLPASTTKLNKEEMSDYMERISALVEIPIPNPCENGYFCGKKSCMICK